MKKNNDEKINPIMDDQRKNKNIRVNKTNVSEDENIVKKFILITIVIALIIGIVYGFTEWFKKDEPINDDIVTGSINYDKISVGMLLNRPYSDYYVLAYKSEDKDAVLYSTILTKYMQKSNEEEYIKIYFCDLDNTLNQKYYNVNNDNKSNPSAKSIKDLDFGEVTLLKIEEGKISNYIENIDKIKETLSKGSN